MDFLKKLISKKILILVGVGLFLALARSFVLPFIGLTSIIPFLEKTHLALHIGIAFWVAAILEVVNEEEFRNRIGDNAKDSMKEAISIFAKTITKSEEVGKSLDKLIERCSTFYRYNQEIRLNYSKKNTKLYRIEQHSSYEVKNLTNKKAKYAFMLGTSDDNPVVERLQIDGELQELKNPVITEKHGEKGLKFEAKKPIDIAPGGTVSVKFTSIYEKPIDAKELYSILFVQPTTMNKLQLSFDASCNNLKKKISVITKGVPDVKKVYSSDYEFDRCFLPFEGFVVRK